MYYRDIIDFVRSESTKKNKDGTPVLFQIAKILNNLKNNNIDYASARNTYVRYGDTNIVLRAINSCEKEDSKFEKISTTTGEINLIFFTSELHKSGLNVYEMSKTSEEFEDYLISLLDFICEVITQVSKVEGLIECPRTIEAELAAEAPLKLFFLANDAVAKCFIDILQDQNSSIKTRFPRLYATGNFDEERDGDKYYRWLMTGRDVELLYGLNN